MIIKTCTKKRYVLDDCDEKILKDAAALLDGLYANCEEHGTYEDDFRQARDNIDYLLNELKQEDMEVFWEENYNSIEDLP